MSPVFVDDCDCLELADDARWPNTPIEVFKTDQAAAKAGLIRWIKRLSDDTNPSVRYWCVHGPSGHLIALRDISRDDWRWAIGQALDIPHLPPRPPTLG